MSKKVTIQTKNVDIEIKKKAEEAVKNAGFGGLNDAIRMFVNDLASGEVYLKTSINRKVTDPELQESIDQYLRGEYKTLDPNKKLSEQLLGR